MKEKSKEEVWRVVIALNDGGKAPQKLIVSCDNKSEVEAAIKEIDRQMQLVGDFATIWSDNYFYGGFPKARLLYYWMDNKGRRLK